MLPTQYEVIKLDTGQEIMGMTRKVGSVTEITLPMHCHLSMTRRGRTLATFYPYSPLTSDTVIKIPEDMILHRNSLNRQIVPLYDNASSKWLTMIEGGNIPLDNALPMGDEVDARNAMDDIVKRITELHDEHRELEMMDSYSEEIDDLEGGSYEDFFSAITPKDKRKFTNGDIFTCVFNVDTNRIRTYTFYVSYLVTDSNARTLSFINIHVYNVPL